MTPELNRWAARHHVTTDAMRELASIFGLHGGHTLPDSIKGTSEAAVQAAVRLEAAAAGCHLWRNNVGVLMDTNSRPVRFGLANDSKQLNEAIKSADLIGWRTMLIEPHHVGQQVAVFVSRECKRPGWHYTGSDRERAQLAWAQLVAAAGGDAAFCTGVGTLTASALPDSMAPINGSHR